MTTEPIMACSRASGTWPDGEPTSVRSAGDVMPPQTTGQPDAPIAEADGPSGVSRRMPVTKLTSIAEDLLYQASELHQPSLVLVLASEQRIGFQLDCGVASYAALWQWADLFGYTVEISRSTRKGRRLASVIFTYYGVGIEVYAYI